MCFRGALIGLFVIICHLPGEVKQIIPKKGILKVIKNIL